MKSVLTLIVLACSCSVLAQKPENLSESGNAFVRTCSALDIKNASSWQTSESMMCMGYVEGFIEASWVDWNYQKQIAAKQTTQYFCNPNNVENAQLVRIVLKYINDHPEKANRQTAELTSLALSEAFPCK